MTDTVSVTGKIIYIQVDGSWNKESIVLRVSEIIGLGHDDDCEVKIYLSSGATAVLECANGNAPSFAAQIVSELNWA